MRVMIEKLKHIYLWVDKNNKPLTFLDKSELVLVINELVDAVNKIRMETQIISSMSHAHTQQIQWLQKIVTDAPLYYSKDKVEQEVEELMKENLVPQDICFLRLNWTSPQLSLYFDEKSLWYNNWSDDWYVGNFSTESAKELRIPCKLVRTPISECKVWDWLLDPYGDKHSISWYVLVTELFDDWYSWMYVLRWWGVGKQIVSWLSEDPYKVVILN